MPYNSNPPPNERRFVKTLIWLSALEAVMFIAIFFVTTLLYGDPFAFEKAWPIWLGGLSPIYIALPLTMLQLRKKD